MMSMKSLKVVAQETLKILDEGGFRSSGGDWIEFSDDLERAVRATKLYPPDDLDRLLSVEVEGGHGPTIIVTDETTQIAAQRLVFEEHVEDLVLLNFASARNPGGGFIRGAKAQEEDLARCSGLYKCLLSQMKYYEENREYESLLYTDNLIYSPYVPWFRVRNSDKPESVFLASVITAPAPNARQALRHGETIRNINDALRRRCAMVLGVARDNGHRNILLGAWGCGVFGNDPAVVANCFAEWLDSSVFKGTFDRVVFAVFDRSKDRAVLSAFEQCFG